MVTAKVELDRFDGSGDFGIWRTRMRAILVQMKIAKALEGETKLPASMSADEKAEMLEMAYSTIILHLSDKVLRQVSKEKSAAGVWLRLEQLYMSSSLTSKIWLKGRLFGFKMSGEKPIEEYLDDFSKLILDLENMEVTVEDEDQAIILLNSLPASYANFVETMKLSKDSLSLEEVVTAIKQKQLESKVNGGDVADGLVVHKSFQKKFDKKKAQKPKAFEKSAKSDGGSFDKKKLRCFYCHKEGHFRRDCPERKKTFGNKFHQKDEAALAEESYEDAEALVIVKHESEKVWILDSGCSCHMTPKKEWLHEFKAGSQGTVHLGNNKGCKMEGVGKVIIKKEDGSQVQLTGVRYVPELKRNLISLGALESQGYEFSAGNGKLIVSKLNSELITGVRRNGIYVLVGQTCVAEQLNSVEAVSDKTSLWHLRLGHLSNKGLLKLSEQGCFGGDRIGDVGFCENCTLGKSTKLSFGKGVHKSQEKLNYVYSDLWGPTRVQSHGGKRYFISFIDDYSRRAWVFFLTQKSDAFKTFKDWKATVENQSGKKIKYFMTENGLEYLDSAFLNFCKECGITKHHIVPGNPQQNGVAERYNRTLLERIRCMLI